MRCLEDYRSITDQLLRFMVRESEFSCEPRLDEVLQHPKLIAVFSHSTPLSWLPAPCLITAHICALGQGHRVPIGVMDRFFFQVPILKHLAEYITQSDRVLSFDELIRHFQSLENADLVVFPEGSNCFFGDPNQIQDFRSPRFVEIAIQTGVPLLLIVHSGSESWAQMLQLKSTRLQPYLSYLSPYLPDFLQNKLSEAGVITLPWAMRPIEKFKMRCQLYTPLLRSVDLASDKTERREQIVKESESIRQIMQKLLRDLQNRA